MIGAARTVSRAPSSPTRTGHSPAFSHCWAAAGSVADRKAPDRARRTAWTEQKLRRRASALSRELEAVVFSIRAMARTGSLIGHHVRARLKSGTRSRPFHVRARLKSGTRSRPFHVRARLKPG